ncbi:MAG: hypothetical protein JW957_02815 [Candidatus Omnitrophica bacterium]|nr:hypothetical protein [Candidatus Omnitrophota bacterium]
MVTLKIQRNTLLLSLILLTSGICFGQVQYNFLPEKPLNYNFKIEGDISYKYEGVSAQEFTVLSTGRMNLELIEQTGAVFSVKMTPSRTLVKLNGMAIEDFSRSETAVSQLISTAIMEIRNNGEVLSVAEISPGVLNLAQVLMMMPEFPDNVRSGKRWTKTMPAFSLPGVPMCSLKFTYLYNEGKEGVSRISLLSNQPIKERRRDGEVIASFTGKNSSRGEFLFDEKQGELKSFEGVIDLTLQIRFEMPPGPDQKPSTTQSLPLNINIKLNVTLSQTAG